MNGFNFSALSNSSKSIDWDELLNQVNTQKMTKNITVILLFSVIFVVSLFGNILVCYVIFSKRQMKTVINYYIANLTISDIMMTVVNLPFNTARLLLDDWPFGYLMCKFIPFVQVNSVYVSTITMCIIALDRYQAIVHPFGRRLRSVIPMSVMLPSIWIVSGLLSLPHAYFLEVTKKSIYIRYLTRCGIVLPEPQLKYKRCLTILLFTTQYLIPLSIASIAYLKIAYHIHKRGELGAMTQQQIANSNRTNRKTINMLIIVLMVFAICWLPSHVYHIMLDFGTDPDRINNINSSTVYFGVYWLAMSSVCYNPFIYSIRNSKFREGVKSIFCCVFCCRCHPIVELPFNSGISQNSFRDSNLTRNRSVMSQKVNRNQRNEYKLENAINNKLERIDRIDRNDSLLSQKSLSPQNMEKKHRWAFVWKKAACNETPV